MLAKFDSLRTGRSADASRTSPGRRWTAGAATAVVVGKAEVTGGDANPRFIVTSLKPSEVAAQHLYETIYCARGEMENRIKECQLDLFADRTSAATMRANQLRLWFASMAYVSSLRPAPHRTGAYAVRRGDLWHHPTQAPETRCPGAHQRAAHQARHGVGLPLAARVRTRSCTIAECRRLTRTRHRTVNRSTDVAAAGPATTLAQTHRLMTFLHPRHADNASQPRPALTASPV